MKLPKLKGSLFTCGRCRKSYSSPLGHVCISSRSFSAGRRLLAPHAEVECPNCGKALGNPLTHRCPSKAGDFKRRKTAHRKQQAAAARRAAAAKRKREAHDPPRCKDGDCQRAACVAYKQGYDDGEAAGYLAGFAACAKSAEADVHLFLILLAADIAWVVRAYFHPFKPCPRCTGRSRPGGTNRGSSARRFGDCGRCGGSRKVQIRGSRTVHRAVRAAVRYRNDRKG